MAERYHHKTWVATCGSSLLQTSGQLVALVEACSRARATRHVYNRASAHVTGGARPLAPVPVGNPFVTASSREPEQERRARDRGPGTSVSSCGTDDHSVDVPQSEDAARRELKPPGLPSGQHDRKPSRGTAADEKKQPTRFVQQQPRSVGRMSI
mmetsp:Transcript_20180/g.60880  ORF Transcript_20180/g.60880 Transcript_20180/m.60880 type:complete len:154 (-) Transcript_20180:37-498(-)